MLRVTVLAILGVVRLACAQSAFDVASVKPNAECESRRSIHPGKLELMCMPLRRLATMAYGAISGDQLNPRFLQVVGGPDWLGTDRFDVIAKADPDVSTARMAGPLLKALLEERFHLKAHVATRELPVCDRHGKWRSETHADEGRRVRAAGPEQTRYAEGRRRVPLRHAARGRERRRRDARRRFPESARPANSRPPLSRPRSSPRCNSSSDSACGRTRGRWT
jgi:hypothetical protein